MPWVTVRNAETGGVANVNADAVQQLRGLGWEPISEPSDEPPVLVSELLHGLVTPAATPEPPPSEPEPPKPTPKSGSARTREEH